MTVIDHLASKLNISGYLIFERVCLLKIKQDKHRLSFFTSEFLDPPSVLYRVTPGGGSENAVWFCVYTVRYSMESKVLFSTENFKFSLLAGNPCLGHITAWL